MATINKLETQGPKPVTRDVSLSRDSGPNKAADTREKLSVTLASLREKELLLAHLQKKDPTNTEIEEIKIKLVQTITDLKILEESFNV
ncbi:MAG: hypothetical protein A3I09_03865 [Deltaproteobacteria bacterium RIFCSPLOWO2_02_FULL_47_10]|nr:MAG: hypothetical protein A3I09_03865 [Deltaproteobacteria bacterium RIFCSPLOWO2_02_FULL_47_10]